MNLEVRLKIIYFKVQILVNRVFDVHKEDDKKKRIGENFVDRIRIILRIAFRIDDFEIVEVIYNFRKKIFNYVF